MNDTQQQVRMTLEEAQQSVDLNKSLQVLLDNEHFKKVFMEHIFKEDVLRMHKLLGDPAVRANPTLLEKVKQELEAVALLDNSLRTIQQEGRGAENLIADYQAAEAAGEFDDNDDDE